MTPEEIEDAVELAEQRLAGGREMHLDRRWEDNADDIAALSRAVLALAEERGRMRAFIQGIIDAAPVEEPDRYDGDNHGDTASNAIERADWYLAKHARAALEPRDHDAATRREE